MRTTTLSLRTIDPPYVGFGNLSQLFLTFSEPTVAHWKGDGCGLSTLGSLIFPTRAQVGHIDAFLQLGRGGVLGVQFKLTKISLLESLA